MGRIYLPKEWLGNIEIKDLQNPTTLLKKEIKEAMEKLLNLAELYYLNSSME